MSADFIMELIVLIGVGFLTALLVYYLLSSGNSTQPAKKTTPTNNEPAKAADMIPGWNRKPADQVMGDLREVTSSGSLHNYLVKRHNGGRIPVISFWWHKERVVSVCSVQAFRESQALYNRPSAIFEQCFEPLHGSKSIQSINNEEWKQRKKLLHGMIRGDNLESFFNCFVEIACEKAATWTPGKPIVLMREMFQMTLKAILNTSLGNIFEDNNGIDKLANLYHQCKCEMDERVLEAPSPDSQRELDFQKTLKELMDQLKKMLQTRRNQLQVNSKKALPLLDALINSGASDDLILSDMVTFLGGFHTSAYFATWMFYFLAKNPDIQEKLYQDIATKVGDDKGMALKAYTFKTTSYLRQVLDEGFRTSMTTTFSGHYSDDDIILDGYRVPAKTPIIHALGVAMNNDAVWDEPDKFNPDRFAPGSPHAKRGPEFRPFGVPHIRRCPANQFTYLMVSVYVTILLRQFTLLAEDGYVPERKHGIATSPKDELHVVVELRKKTT